MLNLTSLKSFGLIILLKNFTNHLRILEIGKEDSGQCSSINRYEPKFEIENHDSFGGCSSYFGTSHRHGSGGRRLFLLGGFHGDGF